MHAQPLLPLPRALPARARRIRKAFQSGTPSAYRLPHEVKDRLVVALEPFRNRDAAFALAIFLGRFWSMPGRVALPFPIDRRALADRQDLQLTEAQVRGAIRTLERIGFLARSLTSGSAYRATGEGLRRKPIPFTFGSDYAPLFIAANRAGKIAHEADRKAGRYQTPDNRQRPSATTPRTCVDLPLGMGSPSPKSPKDKSEAESLLLMGEKRFGLPPRISIPNANLEAALDRLQKAIGIAEAKRGGRG
jgi:hypothetical protein